ncbi:hypothetical protein BJY52DRAFT_1313655 [Lactarius psammicola]|nr:hypothetical protein BJY52DRAFT_1313655 [Lactarius psammicola]
MEACLVLSVICLFVYLHNRRARGSHDFPFSAIGLNLQIPLGTGPLVQICLVPYSSTSATSKLPKSIFKLLGPRNNLSVSRSTALHTTLRCRTKTGTTVLHELVPACALGPSRPSGHSAVSTLLPPKASGSRVSYVSDMAPAPPHEGICSCSILCHSVQR